MQLLLEVKNQSDYRLLMEYIRHLKSVQIVRNQFIEKKPVENSVFQRFYGKVSSPVSLEKIENQLKALRAEWDHLT